MYITCVYIYMHIDNYRGLGIKELRNEHAEGCIREIILDFL